MATVTTKDGTKIFYKDWGTGQPIVFSHGWPLTADDWDGQMLYFGQLGYRVTAMTVAVMAAPIRRRKATIWTHMRTISLPYSKSSI